jgi:hypothetical protein
MISSPQRVERQKRKEKQKMKKLMIALAAVAMAVGAQAASWSWGSNSNPAITPGGSDPLSGANIYLFFGYDSSTAANTAKAGVLSDLRAGNAISGYSQSATLNSSGLLDSQEFTGPEGKLYAFAVILADDAAGNSYMLQTANKNATAMDVGEAMLTFDISSTTLKDISTTGTGAGWYMFKEASAVPEPTSGLLMLLGVAGLALRRRRA